MEPFSKFTKPDTMLFTFPSLGHKKTPPLPPLSSFLLARCWRWLHSSDHYCDLVAGRNIWATKDNKNILCGSISPVSGGWGWDYQQGWSLKYSLYKYESHFLFDCALSSLSCVLWKHLARQTGLNRIFTKCNLKVQLASSIINVTQRITCLWISFSVKN